MQFFSLTVSFNTLNDWKFKVKQWLIYMPWFYNKVLYSFQVVFNQLSLNFEVRNLSYKIQYQYQVSYLYILVKFFTWQSEFINVFT